MYVLAVNLFWISKYCHVRGSVTNNNGFWIGFIDAFYYNQLQHLPINLLPRTRSFPYWTAIAFSSPVTDLVLIYESVTSSASVVRWLTLHSWTLNSIRLLNYEPSYEWMTHGSFATELSNRLRVLLEVSGFFDWPNPSSRTMALESAQPLTEMSTRNLHGGECFKFA
jgi:hypothetical protein